MKKILVLTVAVLLASANVIGQDQPRQEISVWGAGGLSTLKYSTDVGSNKNGIGGSFGVGYNYFFTDQWSLGTGLELSLYNAKTAFDSYSDAYKSNDGEYDFEFRSTVSNYEEKQNTMFLNIPVMAQFQLPVMGENKFYAAGGFKFGIPVTKKYKVSGATLKNSGYYAQWSEQSGRELVMDSQEFMGFGSFDRSGEKKDLDLKVACLLSLEAGMKWKMGEALSLYTGAYFDYGLNDINKDNDKKLVQYNTTDPANFITNSVLQTSLTDKVRPMALGLKVRLAFGL